MFSIDEEAANRHSGRTLRLMLKELLAMSEQPGEWVEIVDHWDSYNARLSHATWLYRTAQGIGMSLEKKEMSGLRIFMRFVKDM